MQYKGENHISRYKLIQDRKDVEAVNGVVDLYGMLSQPHVYYIPFFPFCNWPCEFQQTHCFGHIANPFLKGGPFESQG